MAAVEIQELNLAYLMLAQRLLDQDREMGMFQLHITESMADLLLSLSSRQLSQLAGINQFLFQFRLNDSDQLKTLLEDERGQGLTRTHAALVLSSSTAQG
ncbi:MAG: flagellar transcriptional regulator FlhD [Pseudohongiellaceae bacterium]